MVCSRAPRLTLALGSCLGLACAIAPRPAPQPQPQPQPDGLPACGFEPSEAVTSLFALALDRVQGPTPLEGEGPWDERPLVLGERGEIVEPNSDWGSNWRVAVPRATTVVLDARAGGASARVQLAGGGVEPLVLEPEGPCTWQATPGVYVLVIEGAGPHTLELEAAEPGSRAEAAQLFYTAGVAAFEGLDEALDDPKRLGGYASGIAYGWNGVPNLRAALDLDEAPWSTRSLLAWAEALSATRWALARAPTPAGMDAEARADHEAKLTALIAMYDEALLELITLAEARARAEGAAMQAEVAQARAELGIEASGAATFDVSRQR